MTIPVQASAPRRPPPGRMRWRRAIVAGALAILLAGLAAVSLISYRWSAAPTCRATAGERTLVFTPEQTGNASVITAVALRRGLPARAATIALATAIQESGLRNLDHGDRDSVGLFQQRPSQDWGTVEQVMDPVYSAGKFYDALVTVEDYESRPITDVAQEVQRSAYPTAYADHEAEGRVLASTLAGHSPAGLACRLDSATGGSPSAARDALADGLGLDATVTGRTIAVPVGNAERAWQAASWAVANAQRLAVTRVEVAGQAWQRDAAEWVPNESGSKDVVSVTVG